MGIFTKEQMATLRQNPYVADVSERQMLLTKEFKEIFITEYQSGKTPVRIFREHGFDVEVLGANRIGHAGCRIRKQYEERGTFTGGHGDRGHRNTTNSIASTDSSEDELKQLRHEVNYLRQEVNFLKKISSIRITRKSQKS